MLANDTPAHREILSVENRLRLDNHGVWLARLAAIVHGLFRKPTYLQNAQGRFVKSVSFDWGATAWELILEASVGNHN